MDEIEKKLTHQTIEGQITKPSCFFFFFCNEQHNFLGEKRGGREIPPVEAPLWSASAHAPCHCTWVARRVALKGGIQFCFSIARST
jgi:hypothetical protein